MSGPNPQDPLSPLYQFIDAQPFDVYPNAPDSSPSHFTVRQFVPEGITAALPVVVTKTGHRLQNGQAVRATKFIIVPVANATGMAQLNNLLFYVQGVTLNTFYLADRQGNYIDGRGFTPYVQGGEFVLTGPDLPVVNPSHFPPPGFLVI